MSALRVMMLLVLLMAHPTWAQDPEEGTVTWSVLPAQPTTQDFVQLRLDITGCSVLDDWYTTTDQALREFHVYLGAGDICSYGESSYLMPVGYLAAGPWRVKYYSCTAQDMTICSPGPMPDLLFEVADQGRPHFTIPSWSKIAAFGLPCLLVLLALPRLRGR